MALSFHPASRSRARPMLLAVLLAMLAGGAGCGRAASSSTITPVTAPGRVLPAWDLEWDKTHAENPRYATAQTAFAAAARVLHRPENTLSAPAATAWLASGPAFGLAVVTLDPAGAYQEIVLLTPDPATSSWHLSGGSGLPTPCAQGDPATLGTLALGDTCGTGGSGSLQAPANVLNYWTTPLPTGNVYIILHIAAQATRPATGATTLTLPGGQGWSTRSGAYTSVVLPLPHGQTFALAGTASPASIQQLAAKIAAQINAVVPIPTVLPTPPGAPPLPSATP